MKSTATIVAMLVFASGAAFAGGGPYPEPAIPESGTSKTRAQVMAELRDVQGLGLTNNEGDVFSDQSKHSGPTKTRAQVVAEMREAQRLGLLNFGEGDVPTASPEQEKLIADAGRRAAEPTHLAGK
jgi:Domain of unknown function (DUF4148)